MSGFVLEIQDATRSRRIESVHSFVGEDASGSFGLRAGRARFMTTLGLGLARFRHFDGDWQYLASPGGLLYFADDRLWIGTRRFLLDADYERISRLLQDELLAEERALRGTKLSLRRMEEELLHRLWALGQAGAWR
ncbi:MAG: F0F1 ATP synthase subunit epsilon [Gammaproteobacteria bacterium]